MLHLPATKARADHGRPPIDEHARLTAMLQALGREVEMLREDNKQLRAAVSIYRELVRRASTCTNE